MPHRMGFRQRGRLVPQRDRVVIKSATDWSTADYPCLVSTITSLRSERLWPKRQPEPYADPLQVSTQLGPAAVKDLDLLGRVLLGDLG